MANAKPGIIGIKIDNLDVVKANLDKLTDDFPKTFADAGEASAREILDTVGLRSYPPETASNRPPVPYYVRGVGMQYAWGNNQSSEQYGEKFTVESNPMKYKTVIGNKAAYASRLAGENQSPKLAAKGWRKLYEVAVEKLPIIAKIYNDWINALIRKHGLS